MPKIFEVTLTAIETLNESVKHFTFEPTPESGLFTFIPGQFIRLFIPSAEEKPITRSYSLANNQWDTPGTLQMSASYVKGGVASEYLFNMPIGETIKASGPFGKLVLKDADMPARYLFLSTNTGVTPFRAMLPSLALKINANPALKIVLLEGVRTKDELLYGDDFRAFEEKYPDNFRFIPCFSRASEVESNEYKGYVQNFLNDLAIQPEEEIAYLCGNPNMIDDAFEKLKAIGLPIENIRREKYISP